MNCGIGEDREGLRTWEEGSFTSPLCFVGVGTNLPDIPRRPILHSVITELNGIYTAARRTLLTFLHLIILSSFLTVQVTVNFLLVSLMPGVKSNKQRSQDSSGWMRDAVQTVLGRMDSPLQSCTTLHMVSSPF